jgi:hypothetical protein
MSFALTNWKHPSLKEAKKMFSLRIILAFFSVFSFTLFASIAEICADTHTAVSCSYSDVSAAITTASSGDRVVVPSGSCTWSSPLTVKKAITLQGAGIGKTNISGSLTYEMPNPSSPSLFRLTGFTFTNCKLQLQNTTQYHAGRVRVDHNSINNTAANSIVMKIYGNVYGVIDNNSFTYNGNINWYGCNENSWCCVAFKYGIEASLYFEDNEITMSSKSAGWMSTSGLGAMYVCRYNTWYYDSTETYNGYIWDLHGNQQSGSNHAVLGAEFYGNKIVDQTSPNRSIIRVIDQRGGSVLLFWNKIINDSHAQYQTREECADCLNGHDPCVGPDGQPMHVSNTYYWNNRHNSTLITSHNIYNNDGGHDCVRDYDIALGVDFFTDYTGGGMSKGTLAARPESGSIVGEGYWATNQSCSTVSDDSCGPNPTTPIFGTLYIWDGYKWVNSYTPYAYPHPLRSPSPPQRLRIVD